MLVLVWNNWHVDVGENVTGLSFTAVLYWCSVTRRRGVGVVRDKMWVQGTSFVDNNENGVGKMLDKLVRGVTACDWSNRVLRKVQILLP